MFIGLVERNKIEIEYGFLVFFVT